MSQYLAEMDPAEIKTDLHGSLPEGEGAKHNRSSPTDVDGSMIEDEQLFMPQHRDSDEYEEVDDCETLLKHRSDTRKSDPENEPPTKKREVWCPESGEHDTDDTQSEDYDETKHGTICERMISLEEILVSVRQTQIKFASDIEQLRLTQVKQDEAIKELKEAFEPMEQFLYG